MATFYSVFVRAKNLIGSHSMINDSHMQEIIQAEHDTILNDNTWAERKTESTISTVAPYIIGSVSTVGTALTGNGVAWTSDMVGRWIRFSNQVQFFKITGFTDPTTMTIETAIPNGNVTNVPYNIFQHVYTLPSDCERIASMAYQGPIVDVPREDLDRIDPYRSSRSSVPTNRSYRELSTQGYEQIELWPIPSAALLIRFQYLKDNTTPTVGTSWSADTTSPLYRGDVLVWKSGETAAFYLYSKTGDQSWFALAQRYHDNYNESLQGARLDDLGKNSPAHRIRDVYQAWPYAVGSDFALDHDISPY